MTTLRYCLDSTCHDTLDACYPTIGAARSAQTAHRAECTCGAGVIVRGAKADLLAAGAFRPRGGDDGELVMRDPDGGYPLACEVDGDSTERATADTCPFALAILGEPGSRNWRVAVTVPEESAPEVHAADCERCLADAAGEESDADHEYERDHGNADWPSDERIVAEASRQVGHRVRLVGTGDAAEQGEWVQKIETVPCLASAADAPPCTKPATTLRCVDNNVLISLCAEHAAQLDEEAGERTEEHDGVFYCVDLASGSLHYSPREPGGWLPAGSVNGDGKWTQPGTPWRSETEAPCAEFLGEFAARAEKAIRAAGYTWEDGAWCIPADEPEPERACCAAARDRLLARLERAIENAPMGRLGNCATAEHIQAFIERYDVPEPAPAPAPLCGEAREDG